jgi:Leucine-rich repeat (LRR) protein
MNTKSYFVGWLTCLSLIFLSCSNSDDDSKNINSDKNCTQTVNIPDANFKGKLLSATADLNNVVASNLEGFVTKIDANNDGIIQVCEAENISELTVDNSNISSLEGLLAFRNLKYLSFRSNKVKVLDVSSLQKLHSVYCEYNNITNINVQGLTNLKFLWCSQNELTSLNLSSLPSLESVYFESNKISTLNIENSNKISDLRGSNNLLTTLTIGHLKNLSHLYISYNLLTSLDANNLKNLSSLQCSTNKMTFLNVSNCISLMDIYCDNNVLSDLKLSNCSKLNFIRGYNNKLTTIDLNGLIALKNLDISNNLLSNFDARYCPQLDYLDIYNMANLQSMVLKNGSNLNNYYFGNNPKLTSICCDVSELAEVQNQVNFWGYNCTISTNCF